MRWILATAMVTAAVVVGTDSPRTTSTVAGAQAQRLLVWATYYGWYDNTPPGCATAYSGCAKGTGTYRNPITFASDKHEFPVGTILYYPTLEKYIVMGDDCQECDLEWSGRGPDGGPRFHHLDIWTGGKGGNEFDAINCEDALTQGLPDGKPLPTPFVENPPRNEPVSKEPIFNAKTGHCFGGAKTSSTHGRYRNALSGKCLANRGGVAVLKRCDRAGDENLTFDGAFFVAKGRCLQTKGKRGGWAMDFAACTGGPREQWSVNPNGTITWIQYTRCVSDAHGVVKLTKCVASGADIWSFKRERG